MKCERSWSIAKSLGILFGVVAPSAVLAVPSGYNLAWSDEFSDTSLNTNAWRYWPIPGNHSDELQCFTQNRSQNVSLSNGHLNITVQKEDYVANGTTYHYTSAQLMSTASFTYGYFEISAKMPKGSGYWPAIWLWPKEGEKVTAPWPTAGEMDIAEFPGNNVNEIYSTAHYGTTGHQGSNYAGRPGDPWIDFTSGFHTFGFQWTPTSLKWYIDGLNWFTVTNWNNNGNTAGMPSPFDKPFGILLDVAVGNANDIGGAPGPGTQYPQSMQIDYVRVYQASVPEPGSFGILCLLGTAGWLSRRRSSGPGRESAVPSAERSLEQ